jgi:DnaJ-class molecular chaperone
VKPGTKLRLRELGFADPQKRSPRGDFYAVIEVAVPKELSAEQVAVVAEMKRVGL